MSRLSRVASDSLTSYLRYGVTLLVQLALVPYLISRLGNVDYGLWTLTFSVLGFLTLVDFGFTTGVVRFTAEARGSGDLDRRNRMLGTVLGVYYLLAGVAAVLVAAFSPFYIDLMGLPPETRDVALPLLWVLAARSVAVSLPFGIFRSILFGSGRIGLVNGLQTMGTLLYGGAAVVALESGTGILGLAWATVFAFGIEHLAYLIAAYRTTPGLRLSPGHWDRGLLRQALSISAAQFLVTVSSIVLLRTDPIIVNAFLPLSAVAMYGVALKVAENALMLVKQGINVLGPMAAEMSGAGEHDQVRDLMVRGARFSLAPAVAMAAVAAVLGRPALTAWVGPDYADGAPVLAILMLSVALLVPQMVASGVFSMTGRHRLTAWAAVLSMLVNLAASIAMAAWLGAVGVALGTLVATVLVDVGFVIVLARGAVGVGLGTWAGKVFAPSLGAAVPAIAAMAGLAWALPPEGLPAVMAEALAGCAVFFAAFAGLGMTASERAAALGLLRRRRGPRAGGPRGDAIAAGPPETP
jgi:O-antigen/teichoic acid export membrane protein